MKFSIPKLFKRNPDRGTRENTNEDVPLKMPTILENQDELEKKLVFSLAKQRFPNYQQLQYLPEYLSRKEKLILQVLAALVVVCVGFLLFRFYDRHVVYLPEEGGSYSEALVGQPAFINPVLAQSDVDRDITSLIYSGLFRYDEDLQLVPNLAESYELSEDKKTYTVKLRDDIYWDNGNAILADDILFTIELIQDKEYNSPYYANFRGVTTQRIDDRTVSFTLQEPFAPFLSNLTLGILPGHIWNDITPSNFPLAEYNTKPIGAGPYTFQELVKDRSGNIKSYVLARNESYHGTQPYIETITFKFYPEFESAVEAVKNKNVDGISYVPKDFRTDLSEKAKTFKQIQLQLPQYTAVFFNQKVDLFKETDLKRALAHAINKDRIVEESLEGRGKVIHAPILEGFLGYNPEISTHAYDPEAARQLLDEAGWTVPEEGGLRTKDGAVLKFALTTVDQSEYLTTADILRESWEKIGVGIELKIMNPARVDREVIKPRDYEAFLYGEILGSDPDPYPFWHSSQSLNGGLNLSNYYNKDVDQLLEEARQIDDLEQRRMKYVHFQNTLIDDLPALFLYSPSYDYYVSEEVKGITATRITVPSDRLNGVASWYIKTRLGWE